jgi:hypothetical protein
MGVEDFAWGGFVMCGAGDSVLLSHDSSVSRQVHGKLRSSEFRQGDNLFLSFLSHVHAIEF